MKEQFTKGVQYMIGMEVDASFTQEELNDYSDFQDFWGDVEVQNAYEEEWERWKAKGVKEVYLRVFNERRGT